MPPPHWEIAPSGRGSLDITAEKLAELVANASLRETKVPFDYEHQTEYEAVQAPASGWVEEYDLRADGLWVRVSWTAEAKKMIEAGEYRYVSPAWNRQWVNPKTGKNVGWMLSSAALTNVPYFEEMQELIAASLKGAKMDLVTKLRELLGLVADATTEAVYSAVSSLWDALNQVEKEVEGTAAPLAASLKGKSPIEKLKLLIAAAKQGGGNETLLATAKGNETLLAAVRNELRVTSGATEAELLAAIKARGASESELAKRVQELETKERKATAAALVAKLQSEGKLVAADLPWANEFAERAPVEFEKLMASAKPKVPLDSLKPGPLSPGGGEAEPTAEELQVARMTKVDAKLIAKTRQGETLKG